MPPITDAVILMAGAGSRLRADGKSLPKPLVLIRGRELISYTLDALLQVGITTLHAVVGYDSETLLAGLAPLVPKEIRLHPIHNHEWQKQNGVSLLSAAAHLPAPFLLLMGDHLFEPALLDRFVRQIDPARLNLAVDRKIESIFDLDDAMKVQTHQGRIGAIGKALASYDAIDTGIFVCPPGIFQYLARAAQENGDCSLADAVRLMAAEEKALAFDIGPAWWQDVDDSGMLGEAEQGAVRLTSKWRAADGPQHEQNAAGRDRA